MWALPIGVAMKAHYLSYSWAVPKDSKNNKVSLLIFIP